uniref:RED-like N-terminal domain-containing protein n=1 Tax=Amphimedon queenslandica TaxID=400682 RepID=A0A1X7TN77_AMPQE
MEVHSEMVVRDQEAEEIKKYERRKKEEKEKKRSISVSEEGSIKSKLGIYVFELDDEYEESDIPTTLIKRKADCPMLECQATLMTNEIVINELTQILSYL